MKYVTKKMVLVCVLAAGFSRLCARSVDYSWDFGNVPIRDILYAVSLDTCVTIACDIKNAQFINVAEKFSDMGISKNSDKYVFRDAASFKS